MTERPRLQVIETADYLTQLRAIGAGEAIRERIKDEIRHKPTKGEPLGGNCDKFRVPYRGGARVIHFHIETEISAKNYIVGIYLKSVKPDLTPDEYEMLRRRAREHQRRVR